MAAAATTRARGGGGQAQRRPFAPVLLSPTPQAENRRAVLGARGHGKAAAAAKKCCVPGSSPPGRVSSRKTPAKKAPGTAAATRRRLYSCAKKCATPAGAAYDAPRVAGASGVAEEERDDEAAAYDAPRVAGASGVAGEERGDEVVAAYDAPRAGASSVAEERVRAELSDPCSEAEADHQERRMRAMTADVTMEEAMAWLPEHGEGRVKYLVETFERLLSLRGGVGIGPMAWNRGTARRRRKDEQGAATTVTVSCPATPRGAEEIDVSCNPSIASSSEFSFPVIPEANVACILDASDRTRISSSARGQRRQRPYNSTVSSEKAWSCSRKMTRVTAQQPFRLRTEQRGKAKEGNFLERLMKEKVEEERLRHPVARALPYTTDEPEILAKPPTKEPTEPIDLVLHSDVRVVRRVQFDNQVFERNSFIEELKLERERQKKLEEEHDIKLLRKEMVPRAHPVPDFSKPFMPKKSLKQPTIPKEPRFQTRLRRHTSKEQ